MTRTKRVLIKRGFRPRMSGFTFIELVSVLVILGIVAAIGSHFLITTINSYKSVQERAKLIAKGRVVIEQMTRQIRGSIPNAIRVSGTGSCVEFMPIVGGANYIDELPDSDNGAAAVSSVTTSAFSLGMGTANHAVVGGLFDSEIYSTASPASRVSVNAMGAGTHTSVSFTTSHVFVRNSIRKRIFIADDPKRFCVVGGSLVRYHNYGLDTGAMSDAVPSGATTAIMSLLVTSPGTAFSISAGSEERNTALDISLNFSQGDNQATLNHRALIKNVP